MRRICILTLLFVCGLYLKAYANVCSQSGDATLSNRSVREARALEKVDRIYEEIDRVIAKAISQKLNPQDLDGIKKAFFDASRGFAFRSNLRPLVFIHNALVEINARFDLDTSSFRKGILHAIENYLIPKNIQQLIGLDLSEGIDGIFKHRLRRLLTEYRDPSHIDPRTGSLTIPTIGLEAYAEPHDHFVYESQPQEANHWIERWITLTRLARTQFNKDPGQRSSGNLVLAFLLAEFENSFLDRRNSISFDHFFGYAHHYQNLQQPIVDFSILYWNIFQPLSDVFQLHAQSIHADLSDRWAAFSAALPPPASVSQELYLTWGD